MKEKEEKVFPKRKKLNLKVKQDFQLWFLIRIMGTVLLTIGLASIILYFYALTVVDQDYLSHALKVRKVSEILLPVLLAASLASIIAGLLMALFLPQRIAGPLFRIEQDFQIIRTGDLTKSVNFRHNDILKELAESVNMAILDIRNLINDVKKTSHTLEEKIIAGDSGEIKKALEDHKKCLDILKT